MPNFFPSHPPHQSTRHPTSLLLLSFYHRFFSSRASVRVVHIRWVSSIACPFFFILYYDCQRGLQSPGSETKCSTSISLASLHPRLYLDHRWRCTPVQSIQCSTKCPTSSSPVIVLSSIVPLSKLVILLSSIVSLPKLVIDDSTLNRIVVQARYRSVLDLSSTLFGRTTRDCHSAVDSFPSFGLGFSPRRKTRTNH